MDDPGDTSVRPGDEENWYRLRANGRLDPVELRTDRPHPARVYDYLLGGKDNFPADRTAAEASLRRAPGLRVAARANRDFLARAVRAALADGVRQFIDIGTGIPTSPNVHELAQGSTPGTRVVYVDNDPIVGAHARALLTSSGETAFLLADVRDPKAILDAPETRDLIDFDRPVGILCIATLHHVPDEDDPQGIIERLVGAVPSGSVLALTHLGSDLAPEEAAAIATGAARARVTVLPRPRETVGAYFDGLDLLAPGLVRVPDWRPEHAVLPEDLEQTWIYGGVARKP
ncbi:SAM-dependent methyltransferase [Spongiactinospora sp. TRM90649]|uniref:SAM-dependent methyltransferase n=1 Tax=Spongiactinospora sp. TRM90649 TaxID=3031114 RepID=UPI0023F8D9E6|nr:SAM-dependent methyltransferase [Spongiactinospora sp. TRM90649]MDF5751856.1 SAM-dependent methyltransferase [Spongiactinospora sp. TRM90649]